MQGRELGSAVIAQIRREKFWLDREGEVGARNPLIDDLQASVQHLSEGLYSKETHFVLELIQNAEDNAYTDGVTPSLSMELLDVDPLGTPGAEGALVISNNERGFRPTDVQALCSVGASTKKARKQEGSGAFIGDKGIGFKSVFVVSARPAIFSNGFHFCFNEAPEASTGLGYIVPTSIERVPAAVEAHLAADHTVILLPLKPGKRAKVERELASIAPETLLFLNKIAQLRVVVNGRVLTEVERRVAPVRALGAPGAEGGDHLGEGDACAVVTLLTRTGSGSGSEEQRRDYWFYAHEEALPADVLELSRAGVQARSCAVALPLRSGVDTDDLSALQCSGRVYAFLPTEVHSRVPFLLNADFVLSSSRESIQVHRPWNLWLRNSLATAFVRGFLALLRAPPSAGSARDAYAFAPLTSSSFFAELRTAALATLAGERCVLAQPLAGRSGALVLPADARIAPPALCALLGRCERWPEHLLGAAAVAGRGEEAEDARPRPVSLVDAAVAALYGAQLEALGVRALGVDDWAAILGDARWLGSLDAKELIEVYALLAAEEWTTPAALRGLPLLRIESAPAVRAARRSRGPLSPSPLSPLSPLALHGEARGAMAASSAERPVYAASEEAVPEAVAELLLPILAATDGGAADGAEPMRLMCRAVLRLVEGEAAHLLGWLRETLGVRPLSPAAFVEHAVRAFPLPLSQPTPAPGAASELPTGEETRRGSTQVQATNPPPQQNLRALRMQAISHGQRADPPPLIKTASEMQGTVSASSTHSPTHSQLAPAALTLFRGVRALHARGAIDDRSVRSVSALMPVALESGFVCRRKELEGTQLLVPRAGSKWEVLLEAGKDDIHFAVLSSEYGLTDDCDALGNGVAGESAGDLAVDAAERKMYLELAVQALDLPAISPAGLVVASPGLSETDYPALAMLQRASAGEGEGREAEVGAEQAALLAEWLDAMLASSRMAWEEAKALRQAPNTPGALAELPKPAAGSVGESTFMNKRISRAHVLRRPSELKRLLLAAAWLPTSHGLRPPSQTFFDSQALRDVFGEGGLPFAAISLSSRVCAFLGVPTDASAAALTMHVRRLAEGEAEEAKIELVVRLYGALAACAAGVGSGGARAAASSELAEFEASAPVLVRVPRPRWVKARDCVWSAPADLFVGSVQILSTEYPESLRHYFVERLGVRKETDDSDYAERWLSLSRPDVAARPPPTHVLVAIWSRLAAAVGKRRNATLNGDDWARLANKGYALTHALQLVPSAEALLPDDSELRGALERAGGEEEDALEGAPVVAEGAPAAAATATAAAAAAAVEGGGGGTPSWLPFIWTPREGDGSAGPFLQLGAMLGVAGVGKRAQSIVRVVGPLRGAEALPAAAPPSADGVDEELGDAELGCVLLSPGTKRCIAAFLYNRMRPDFERLCAAGTMRQLFRTREITAREVHVTLTLRLPPAAAKNTFREGVPMAEGEEGGAIVSAREVAAFWNAPKAVLYVGRGGGPLSALEVPRALARQLVGDLTRAGEFEDFVGRAMLMGDDRAREAILKQKGFILPAAVGMPPPPDGVESAPKELPHVRPLRPQLQPLSVGAPAAADDVLVVHGADGLDDLTLTPAAAAKCAALRQRLRALWALPDRAARTKGVRQLLLEWHPDKRRDDPDAPAVFRFLRLEVEKAPPLAGEAGSEAVGGSEAEWVELDEGGAPSAPSPLPPSLPTFYSAAFATQRAARKSTDESLALASLLKEAVFPVPAPPNGSEGERARMLAHVRELLCGWIDSTLPRAMSVLGLIEAEAATTPSANLAVPSPSTASPLRPVTPTRTPASVRVPPESPTRSMPRHESNLLRRDGYDALSNLSQLERFVTLALVGPSLMAQSTFAECMCAALQLPPRAHTHAQFIGRNKLDAVLADTLTAISPSLSAIALRQRIDVVAGPAALALYARAIGLPALLLEDAPTAARPSLQSPRNGARVRPPGDLSLACALESVAGGLYACRSLGAVCRLLCGTLLPAVGAPRLAPFAMGGEAFAAEGALPSPSGEPSARRRDGAEWLAAQPSRLESGRTRRLFGPSAALDLSGFDSDAASDVSAHPSPFPSGHPSPRIAPRPEPHISARADMSPLSPRHASPRSQPRMGPLRESLGGVGTSAAAVVAAMAAAVSSCDSAANSAATTVAAAAASNPAAAAAEASALHADVAAIRREVGQTGQSVGEVLEAVRTLAKSLAALNYERI